MQRAINTTRCCAFGLIWGYGLATIWVIAEIIKQQVTHTADAPRSIPHCLFLWAIGGLHGTGFGLLLGLVPIIVLGFFEKRAANNRLKFVICSVLSMGVWAAVPCRFFAAGNFAVGDFALGPFWGFTGAMRWGLAAYVVALIGSYVVGRELPAEKTLHLYYKYQVGIWIIAALPAALLAIAISFPTFG